MTLMKAFRALDGEKTGKLVDIEIPKVGADDVLIKVKSAGLAPGVFNLLQAGMLKNLPMTLGHEIAGEVVETGSDVDNVVVGARVRVYSNMSCGTCKYCASDREQMCDKGAIVGFAAFGDKQTKTYIDHKDGGFAEYICVPAFYVDELPKNVNYDVGAKMTDLASAMRCLKAAELPAGSTLIIIAATGSMGTSSIKLAEFFGVARLVLIGRSSERLEALRGLSKIPMDMIALDKLGDDWTEKKALAQAVARTTRGQADAILDYGAHGPDMWQALAGLATNGSFVHMGGNRAVLPVPMIGVMQNCWRIIGTRNHTRSDSDLVLKLLADGSLNVDELITHNFPLAKIEEAVSALQSRSLPIWMAVINPE